MKTFLGISAYEIDYISSYFSGPLCFVLAAIIVYMMNANLMLKRERKILSNSFSISEEKLKDEQEHSDKLYKEKFNTSKELELVKGDYAVLHSFLQKPPAFAVGDVIDNLKIVKVDFFLGKQVFGLCASFDIHKALVAKKQRQTDYSSLALQAILANFYPGIKATYEYTVYNEKMGDLKKITEVDLIKH